MVSSKNIDTWPCYSLNKAQYTIICAYAFWKKLNILRPIVCAEIFHRSSRGLYLSISHAYLPFFIFLGLVINFQGWNLPLPHCYSVLCFARKQSSEYSQAKYKRLFSLDDFYFLKKWFCIILFISFLKAFSSIIYLSKFKIIIGKFSKNNIF